MPIQAPSSVLRNVALSFVVSIGILTMLMALTATKAEAAGAESFGIAVGGTMQNQDQASLDRDLDLIRDSGAKWIRVDINWAQIQNGGPNSYYWDDVDRVVAGANARGLQVLGLIVYTPGWARPAGTSGSYGPDPATYSAFAAKAVQHYSAMGVQHYEIWNEPNIQAFWQPRPDVGAYTRLLKAAYASIKAVNPQATVLTAGTSPASSDGTDIAPVDFVRGIYANGGKGSFDAVAHHPYGWPALPGGTESWNAWYQMSGATTSIRSTMVANGDGAKKIWATEFGAPTAGPSGSFVSEAAQAEMITRAHALWRTYDWAGGLFTYQHRDQGTTNDTRENHFGLVRRDYSPKPAWTAYTAATGGATAPSAEPEPTSPTPDPTDVDVKGKGKGGGKVKGRVVASGFRRGSLSGRVELVLYRNGERGWRPASSERLTAIAASGRFGIRLREFHRKLREGTYRVRASYLGSNDLKASTAQSRRFKVRA